MKKRLFSYLQKYGLFAVKYSFFTFNLALLAGLSVKTVNLWIVDFFTFSDTLTAFPEEPEFLPPSLAEREFWTVTVLETLLFIIGGFFCYELLIRPKTLRRSFIAPAAIIFLWTAGESFLFFFPATEKVMSINACTALNISWDRQRHKCRLMDLETKRFEQTKTSDKSNVSVLNKTEKSATKKSSSN